MRVTILPDGVRGRRGRRRDPAAGAGPGRAALPGGLQARRLRHLQGAAQARRGPLRAPDRRPRAQRRRARRGHLLSCRAVPLTNIVIELQEGTGSAASWDSPSRLDTPSRPGTIGERKDSMSAVMRLGYVHLRVTDLEEARNHYSNTLGMEVVHEEPGKLWLKCWDEWDHHSLVIEEGGVGLVKLGYKVESHDALADFERAPSSSVPPTAGSARGRTSRSATGCGSPCRPSTPSSSTPTWSSPAPRPGRSTPRPGRGTSAGSARTGSTTP